MGQRGSAIASPVKPARRVDSKPDSASPRERGRSFLPGRTRSPIVSATQFVLATRDAGYKSTTQAVAEFIDNSLQASATSIAVDVVTRKDGAHPIELVVTDDGCGMDSTTLATALTFGGSSRFGDRSSLGRYGMGLPNGALSRARRVEVYTWRGSRVLTAQLDIDEIVAKGRRTLRPVEAVRRPPFIPRTPHGTSVWLRQCDRLEYKRAPAIVKKLKEDLGRIYRLFIACGLDLRVNGEQVEVVDPLFLEHPEGRLRARQFGDTLNYQMPTPHGVGRIEVRFSELPVERLQGSPPDEKRRLGITSSPCVSIVRAKREIDRGWFFMGTKRRENYDDWWRCEIRFDPALDELFGITHAKQGIAPREEMLNLLAPDLEPIARALNGRVRRRFELVKTATPLSDAERQAARAEHVLPALPSRREPISEELRQLIASGAREDAANLPYRIIVADLPTTAAFEVAMYGRQLILFLNTQHPLYRDLYGPLAISESVDDQCVAKRIALAVLAAARAEAGTGPRQSGRKEVRRFRQEWADVLATFFNA